MEPPTFPKWFTLLTISCTIVGICGGRFCTRGSSCSEGRSYRNFQYAGRLSECGSHQQYAVGRNNTCTSSEVSAPSFGIVALGDQAAELPSRMVCYGRDRYFPRCNYRNSQRSCKHSRMVCRPLDTVMICPDITRLVAEGTNITTVQFEKNCGPNNDTCPTCSVESTNVNINDDGSSKCSISHTFTNTNVRCYCQDGDSCTFNVNVTIKQQEDSIRNLGKNDTTTLSVTSENVLQKSEILVVDSENLAKNKDAELKEIYLQNIATTLEKIVDVNETSEAVTQQVVEVVNNYLTIISQENRNVDADETIAQTSQTVLMSVETQLDNFMKNKQDLNYTNENIVVRVRQIPQKTGEHFNFVNYKQYDDFETFAGSLDKPDEVQVAITLPQEVGGVSDQESVSVRFVLHLNTALFKTPENDTWLVSPVMAASTTKQIKNLENPIEIRFGDQYDMVPDFVNATSVSEDQVGDTCKEIKCVFWDFEMDNHTGGWSSHGCTKGSTDENNITICLCDHLTNFAILLDMHGDIGSSVLDFVSIIGCAISIVSLIITIITFLYIKKIRNKRPQQIVLQICIALLGLYIVFVAGIERKENIDENICKATGALLHYFCLAVVAWMSIEATNMYLLFVRKDFNKSINYFILKASLLGWGLPAVIVIVNALCDNKSLTTCEYCFLRSDSNGFRYGLLLVIGLLLTYNVVIFILVTWNLTAGRKKNLKPATRQETIRRLQAVIAISVLFGLTWVSGFLAIGSFRMAANIIFCVLNSLQGFFIFLLLCVRQKDIRSEWKNFILIRPLNRMVSKRITQSATKKRSTKRSKEHLEDTSEMSKFDKKTEFTSYNTITESQISSDIKTSELSDVGYGEDLLATQQTEFTTSFSSNKYTDLGKSPPVDLAVALATPQSNVHDSSYVHRDNITAPLGIIAEGEETTPIEDPVDQVRPESEYVMLPAVITRDAQTAAVMQNDDLPVL